jgi:polysaccharide export outer membrane protein
VIKATHIGCLCAALLVSAVPFASAQVVPQIGSSMQSPGQSGGVASSAANAAGAAGAAKAAVTPLIAVPEDFSKLKIAPGFLLNIQAFDEPELSGELRVDDSGNIAVPLAGTIYVGDCTLAEARQRIEARLISEQILLRPQLTVDIGQYAPFIVAVMGEVQTPGRVQLLAPHSLLDILSQVGGETQMAGGSVQVRHTRDGRTTTDAYPYGRNSDGSSIANVLIHDGDTVIVPRAGIVYVLGAVNRPGGYLMQEDGVLDVAQALSLAMGTTLQAAVTSVRVVRRNADGSYVEYPINYTAISKGKQIPLRLQAQDIVYVPVSKIKTVFTSGASLINEAAYSSVILYK